MAGLAWGQAGYMAVLGGYMDDLTQDYKDMIALANTYLSLTRCKGGRVVNEGYSCPHCGSNDPEEHCGNSESNRGLPTMFDPE